MNKINRKNRTSVVNQKCKTKKLDFANLHVRTIYRDNGNLARCCYLNFEISGTVIVNDKKWAKDKSIGVTSKYSCGDTFIPFNEISANGKFNLVVEVPASKTYKDNIEICLQIEDLDWEVVKKWGTLKVLNFKRPY